MKVLIAPVGSSDPYSERRGDEPGPVLTLAQHDSYDFIYLIYTRHPSGEPSRVVSIAGREQTVELDYKARAGRTRDAIGTRGGPSVQAAIDLVPLTLENPTDYREVLSQAEQVVRQIKEHLRELAGDDWSELVLDVSAASGTPALKAAMILLVSAGVLSTAGTAPRVFQVADPVYGEANKGRVSEVDVTVIEATRLVDHAADLMQHERLDAALEDLRRLRQITPSIRRRRLLGALIQYVEALQKHRLLAYGEARKAMKEIDRSDRTRLPLEPIAPLRARQIELLDTLHRGVDTVALLHDLLLSVERQRQRGEYADAVARAWQVTAEVLEQRAVDVYEQCCADSEKTAALERWFRAQRGCRVGPDEPMDLARAVRGEYMSLYPRNYRELLLVMNDVAVKNCFKLNLPEELALCFDRHLARQLRSRHAGLKGELIKELGRGMTAESLAEALVEGRTTRIKNYQDLFFWVNIVRNRTVVAHGHVEVDAVDAEAASLLVDRIVEDTYGLPAADHPFGSHTHHRTVQWIRQALRDA